MSTIYRFEHLVWRYDEGKTGYKENCGGYDTARGSGHVREKRERKNAEAQEYTNFRD